MSINSVTVEHSMATNGILVPVGDLEVRRTVLNDVVTKEEFYCRGHVYARFFTWTNNTVTDTFTEDYVKPSNASEWNYPGATPVKPVDYPFNEFYPWQALKLVAFNVLYDQWKDNNYVVGDNAWAV